MDMNSNTVRRPRLCDIPRLCIESLRAIQIRCTQYHGVLLSLPLLLLFILNQLLLLLQNLQLLLVGSLVGVDFELGFVKLQDMRG